MTRVAVHRLERIHTQAALTQSGVLLLMAVGETMDLVCSPEMGQESLLGHLHAEARHAVESRRYSSEAAEASAAIETRLGSRPQRLLERGQSQEKEAWHQVDACVRPLLIKSH